jgi:hypothetical protein
VFTVLGGIVGNVSAQKPTGPAFVASFKVNTSGAVQTGGIMAGNRFSMINETFWRLVGEAYATSSPPRYLIIGGPDWINTDRFDVEGCCEQPDHHRGGTADAPNAIGATVHVDGSYGNKVTAGLRTGTGSNRRKVRTAASPGERSMFCPADQWPPAITNAGAGSELCDGILIWPAYRKWDDPERTEPVDNDTVFAACSNTQSVFAYGVLKLCEKGVLDLDMPLTKYTKRRITKDPRIDLITARHVLTPHDRVSQLASGARPSD